MKLELKHLAPYLPYDIRCKILNYKSDYVGREYGHLEGYYFLAGKCHYMFGGKSEAGKTSDLFIPILKPLSDYCGTMIAREGMDLLNCDLESINEIWDLQGTKDLDVVSLKTYNVMCRNHLDFNNLIPQGLAISIHDINQ